MNTKRTIFIVGIEIIAFALASCISGAPGRVGDELGVRPPARWEAGGNSNSVGDKWWKVFNDSELNSLIAEAFRYNRDLGAAAARVQTAVSDAKVSSAELFPSLGAGLDGSRRQNVTDALGIPGFGGGTQSFRNNTFGAALNTSWEIDLWGRIRKNASASTADLQAAEAEYAAKALSLAGQTSKSWFALTEARQQLALAQETRDSYKKTAKQAADRVELGVQSPTDKHLAESNLASAEALMNQRQEAVQRASRQLDVLVGRYPSGKSTGARALPSVPRTPGSGVPADLIRRRPDLIAAERRVAASDQRVGSARASLYPRLSLTGSAGSASSEIKNLLNGDFGIWSIAGNLVQPVFQGGRLRAQVSAAKGRQRESAENFAQAALTAYSEVETSLSVESTLAGRENNLKSAATSARKAATIANNRYDQGVDGLLIVLESQRRSLDAESALISARRARLDNRIDLHLALGGGF